MLARPGPSLKAALGSVTLRPTCIGSSVASLVGTSRRDVARFARASLYDGRFSGHGTGLTIQVVSGNLHDGDPIQPVASIVDTRMAWNSGALAMIGIFGSKNSLGSTQGMLVLISTWILLDREQTTFVRALALVSAAVASYLLLAARSADAITGTIGGIDLLTLGIPIELVSHSLPSDCVLRVCGCTQRNLHTARVFWWGPFFVGSSNRR